MTTELEELQALIPHLPLDRRYREFLLKGAAKLPADQLARVLHGLKSMDAAQVNELAAVPIAVVPKAADVVPLFGARTVVVPVDVWSFQSPDLALAGIHTDVGLLAESLVYHESSFAAVQNARHVQDIVKWFARFGEIKILEKLLSDRVLQIGIYSFLSTAIEKDGLVLTYNVQEENAAIPGRSKSLILARRNFQAHIGAKNAATLEAKLMSGSLEWYSEQFSEAIEAARADQQNPVRQTNIVRSLLGELRGVAQLPDPSTVNASVRDSGLGRIDINWGMNIAPLESIAGLGFHRTHMITAAAICNRLIATAARLGAGLYLSRPMAPIVLEKLATIGGGPTAIRDLLRDLERRISYPDIRARVNRGQMAPSTVLALRAASKPARVWLQDDGERDPRAFAQYLQEAARAAKVNSVEGRHKVSQFSRMGGSLAPLHTFEAEAQNRASKGWQPIVTEI